MQRLSDGRYAYLVCIPPSTIEDVTKHIQLIRKPQEKVTCHLVSSGARLENRHLTVDVDRHGRISQMTLKQLEKRTVVAPGHFCNQLVMYDDVPFFWDAWDVMPYHLQTRREVNEVISELKIIEKGPLRAVVEVQLKMSETSHLQQTICLDADSPFLKVSLKVHWNENRKFLKVEFPVSVRSQLASYDIQFGHVQRPTHANTSWDAAKHEVCGHKWIDLSEHGFGVALLSDSKYGYSTMGNVMRISLLRSPKAPDATADIGIHEFSYAMMPHAGSFQSSGVIKESYNFNCPLLADARLQSFISHHPEVSLSTGCYPSLLLSSNPAIVIDTIKMAHDNTNVLIVRLYESFGCTSFGTLTSDMPLKQYCRCNILEEAEDDIFIWKAEGVEVQLGPFEVQSLMVHIV